MRLETNRTVLVDVDTQVDFVEPDGALYVPGAERLKAQFAQLVRAARARGVPIVASADAHGQDDPEFSVFPPHCVAGTAGQKRVEETALENPLVVPVDGTLAESATSATVLLEKVKFDLFSNPAAERVLARTGAETAIVFGVALDYCVRAAALGLRSRGYDTVLVTDATAPVTEEGGAKVEAELKEAGVRFATTDEVLAALE